MVYDKDKLVPEDHLNNSVVHMRDQRNAKKGLFFEADRDWRESGLGVKMCLFMRKRILLDSIKGCLGSFLKLHQTCPQKKKGKYGDKITRNCVYGCFSRRGEIAISVYFENLWSRMCTTVDLR